MFAWSIILTHQIQQYPANAVCMVLKNGQLFMLALDNNSQLLLTPATTVATLLIWHNFGKQMFAWVTTTASSYYLHRTQNQRCCFWRKQIQRLWVPVSEEDEFFCAVYPTPLLSEITLPLAVDSALKYYYADFFPSSPPLHDVNVHHFSPFQVPENPNLIA